MNQRSGSTSRGDDPPRAAVDALLCSGKVSASWQVEGSSFRVELSNYLEASYTLEDRGTDRDRRGAARRRWQPHETAAVAQSGLDKEPRKRVIPRQRVCQGRCFSL